MKFSRRSDVQLALGSIFLSFSHVRAQTCQDYPCGNPGMLGFTPYAMCHDGRQEDSCLPVPFIWALFGGYRCGPCTGSGGGGGGGGGGGNGQSFGGGWGQDSFQITLQYEGVSSSDSTSFSKAAKKWSGVITSGVPDVVIQGSLSRATDCGSGLPGKVDDIHICSLFKSVDGVSGVLGFAGPRVIDVESGFTRAVTGDMVFDSADMENLRKKGSLDSVIFHEMGHVLGVGTLWGDNGLRVNGCTYSKNTKVAQKWYEYSGCKDTDSLVEQNGAAGTRCSHWSESCFKDELMTGFLSGSSQPLSPITLAGLEDLGYSVDYSAADSFSADDINKNCLCRRRDRNIRAVSTSHGEKPEARRLSGAGEQAAIDFGKAILSERSAESAFRVAGDEITENSVFDSSLQDFGVKGLIVLYEEDDQIYSVDVFADM